jgi:hypothetical protein
MNALQKRFALFLFGCMPARFAFAWVAKKIPLMYLPYMGFLALLPAIGFLYLFFTGKRTTGAETGGAPIWWTKLRVVHGLLYLLFAYYAINRMRQAYKVLLADAFIGLVFFIGHHYQAGNFAKLF